MVLKALVRQKVQNDDARNMSAGRKKQHMMYWNVLGKIVEKSKLSKKEKDKLQYFIMHKWGKFLTDEDINYIIDKLKNDANKENQADRKQSQ